MAIKLALDARKLTDFGIAKREGAEGSTMTATGPMNGSKASLAAAISRSVISVSNCTAATPLSARSVTTASLRKSVASLSTGIRCAIVLSIMSGSVASSGARLTTCVGGMDMRDERRALGWRGLLRKRGWKLV